MAEAEVIPVDLGFVKAYIVRQDGAIIVDTGVPGSENKILGAAQGIGLLPEDIRLIIVTHGHRDHAGSVAGLAELTGAKTAVHSADAEKVRKGEQGRLKPAGIAGSILGIFMGRKSVSCFPPAEPDLLLKGEFDLSEYGVRGKIVPTPGHTSGSVSVILESGDAITGDLIFPSFLSGKPRLPFWAEDMEEVKKSIGIIYDNCHGKIYAGHGGPFSAEDLLHCVK